MIFSIFLLGISNGVMQACENRLWVEKQVDTKNVTTEEYWTLCASAQTAFSMSPKAVSSASAVNNSKSDYNMPEDSKKVPQDTNLQKSKEEKEE